MNEGIGPADEAIVRATADYVHRLGFGMHWIPYFRAPGAEKCSELGFDFAVLQPNYAFMEQSGLHPNQQRLTDTARLARQYHLGIEIEMVSSISSRSERDNLRDYLIHGADSQDGYMRQAVHAYYAGEKCITQLCFSDLPADRELYESLYQFAKGTYVGRRQTVTQQISYRLHGQTVPGYPDDGRKLTDGVRAVGPRASQQIVGLDGDERRSSWTWPTCSGSKASNFTPWSPIPRTGPPTLRRPKPTPSSCPVVHNREAWSWPFRRTGKPGRAWGPAIAGMPVLTVPVRP